jgi:hypothetical protein
VRVLAGVTPSFLAVEALAALTRRMPPLSKMTDDSPEAS